MTDRDLSNPFTWVDSISQKTGYLIEDGSEEKGYSPFFVNRHLSLFPDTVLLAQEMNTNPDLDKRLQYDFLYNSVAKRRRFGKWPKRLNPQDLKMVAAEFQLGRREAEQALSILRPDDLERIRAGREEGGEG